MDKESIKKLNDHLDHLDDRSEISDPELVKLMAVASKLHSSAFPSSSPSSAFQIRLKEKIKEARKTSTSNARRFSFDTFSDLFRSFFKLPHWRPILATIVLFAVVITSVQIIPLWQHSTSTQFSRLIIDTAYAQDNFDVEPTKADSIGVEVNSAFTIKSKQVIDQDALSKNLKLVPEIPYTLQKVSDHEFAILPKEPLQANTVHRVYISSSYVNDQGITVDRPYSWAFQIKDIFKVLTTLPADKSPEVPLNTGIEITFSHDNVTNYEKNFSIEPLVKGRFEQKGRTVVFIPTEPLKPATIYSVKISKNISVVGSNETLDKDYVINFETAASGDNTNRPRQTGFIDSMVEFDARTAPAIPVFTDYYGSYSGSSDSSTPGTEQPARVFKFNSSQEFITELQRKETIPSWSDYNRSVYRVPTTKKTKND